MPTVSFPVFLGFFVIVALPIAMAFAALLGVADPVINIPNHTSPA